ncbi:amino acid adenylation domain-containing protein [Streptomyces sp. NPDC088910]|uniref:amino acid adenylation domain-containing protein n=1 Tax=Streptomyces sp. NPDC088910 TaxID=3365911 RepID=UPI00380075F8
MSALRRVTASEAALAAHRQINATAVGYPRDSGVPALFEERARLRPEAPAVEQGARTVGYGQLDRLANGLARDLLARGLPPGATVGVCLDRSPELVVALLAVLKCGGCYLPFDASWPDERLRALLSDADCRWVLTDRPAELADRLDGCRTVPVTRGGVAESERGPEVEVAGDAVAYVNFTSGSTGRPKGVPVRHRGVVRLVSGARYARLGEGGRLLQLAPVTFDAATFEIWGALLTGGTCVLYPDARLSLSKLGRVLRESRVNVLFLTTALFNSVLDKAPEALDTVATVLTGGERASVPRLAQAVRRYGPGRLVHVYGPTESTTFATYHRVDALPADAAELPIGRPIQNTRLYVIDTDGDDGGELCEPGRAGEIWLAGDGLSPGYLGMPELTARLFVEREVDGVRERLYRTGDYGHLRADGAAVFHGRRDDQVKVNGYRIELGEIAHHLDRHPAVRRSFVTASARGEKPVWAFVVTDDPACTPQALRAHLRALLPGFMVPARIQLCDTLPLTASGKIDRTALLAAHARRPAPEET